MAFDQVGGIMKNQGESQTEQKTHVWVVVVSKPGQERRAKHELKQQGFEVYLPMKLFVVQRGPRKGETMATPFFPRYLFARVPVAVSEWREIFSTYGVAGVLGCSPSRAYGVKDVFVQRLKDQEEGGYLKVGLPDDVAAPAPGTRVRHEDWGLEGVFEQLLNERVDEKRAAFLVSFMGRDSRFVVDLRKLKATERQTDSSNPSAPGTSS